MRICKEDAGGGWVGGYVKWMLAVGRVAMHCGCWRWGVLLCKVDAGGGEQGYVKWTLAVGSVAL